jgi:two-component system NtrC family sensor kinase
MAVIVTESITLIQLPPEEQLDSDLLFVKIEQALDTAQRLRKEITERQRAEKELQKLSLATLYSPTIVMITDVLGNIEFVNPKFTAITGYTAEEVIGKPCDLLKSGRHSQEFYESLWKIIKSGKCWFGEFCNKKKNGTLYCS